MKHLVSLALFTILLLGLSASTFKSSPLTGKWRGEDGGEVGFIMFDKKGFVTLSIGDQEIGGKKYLSDGVLYDMTYETDDSSEPNSIDFIVQLNEDLEEISRMPGIYKFIDKETLVINMKFDGSGRPTAFDDESDDQISLTRTK